MVVHLKRVKEERAKGLMLHIRSLAQAAVISALYIALTLAFAPISFQQIQFRVANVIIGLTPIIGLPAVYGIAVGVLIANVVSPFGPLDMLSSIPAFVGLLAIYYLRNTSVLAGLTIYSLIVSLWVSFLISFVVHVSLLATFAYVLTGIFLSTTVAGYIVYKSARRILAK
ncbi:MAG: QueT transporter family protein [Nitrososphaerota archaeon]